MSILLPAIFMVTVALSAIFLYRAALFNVKVFWVIVPWLLLTGALAYNGFYIETSVTPPRVMLLIAPPLAVILLLFLLPAGKRFIAKLDIRTLTLLHVLRIPVELVLLWLAVNKLVPFFMTFEGHNFDIFSGLSAPVIHYFVFVKKSLNRNVLIAWNLLCLGLLLNVVITGILSAPTPFQQLAFDQPNVAVLQFPYCWLPAFIVPVVLFAHLVALKGNK